MELIEGASLGLCLVSLASCAVWLLLSEARERRYAKFAADLAVTYGVTDCAPTDEKTWPIVAQQPQVEFPNAVTIRIPHQVVDDVHPRHVLPSRHAAWEQENNPDTVTVPHLLANAIEAGDPLRVEWPTGDLDDSGRVRWADDMPTDVLPVVEDDRRGDSASEFSSVAGQSGYWSR